MCFKCFGLICRGMLPLFFTISSHTKSFQFLGFFLLPHFYSNLAYLASFGIIAVLREVGICTQEDDYFVSGCGLPNCTFKLFWWMNAEGFALLLLSCPLLLNGRLWKVKLSLEKCVFRLAWRFVLYNRINAPITFTLITTNLGTHSFCKCLY